MSDLTRRIIASQVLFIYGDLEHGIEPGSFTLALISAISRADASNRALLRGAYPDHVEMVDLARLDSDGMAKLRAIAHGEE